MSKRIVQALEPAAISERRGDNWVITAHGVEISGVRWNAVQAWHNASAKFRGENYDRWMDAASGREVEPPPCCQPDRVPA